MKIWYFIFFMQVTTSVVCSLSSSDDQDSLYIANIMDPNQTAPSLIRVNSVCLHDKI